jgi:hypothetical protein
LNGCINDIKNIYNILVTKYGFKPEQICMLLDSEATTSNILEKLNWLVDVKPGDRVVFWFSGHGCQFAADGDPSEPDGLYEAICPQNFQWDRNHMIIDKQFVSIFSKIPPGCIFCWGSDSCHSQNLSRDLPALQPKSFFASLWNHIAFWKKEPIQKPKHYPMTAYVLEKIRKAKEKGHKVRALIGGILDVGAGFACTSSGTAADAFIDGKPCGAFTYYFTKNLLANPNNSLADLVAAAGKDLANNSYSQVPAAEGARINKPFLG